MDGGLMIGLTGANKGHVRVITAHTDDTSETVTNPYDASMVSGDTFLRTAALFEIGLELTTDFVEFLATGGVAAEDLPDSGEANVVNIWIDGSPIDGAISPNKTRNLYARILSESAPEIGIEAIFMEHVFGNVLS